MRNDHRHRRAHGSKRELPFCAFNPREHSSTSLRCAGMRNNNGTSSSAIVPYVNTEEGLVRTLQLVSWIFAGVCAFLACVVSLKLINGHLANFAAPKVQRKVVGILWIVPIFAIDSWLSLRFLSISVYLDMFRDCYEAYVIHLFLSLMITYLSQELGGEHLFLDKLDQRFQDALKQEESENLNQQDQSVPPVSGAPMVHHMFPFKFFIRTWKLDRTFIAKCKRGTIQFVILKPTLTIIAALCEFNGVYEQGTFAYDKGYLYVTFFENLSITYAAYILVLFYVAFKKQLKPYGPVPKFLCIKAVLFLSFWQSVLLAILSRFHLIHDIGKFTTEDVKTGLNNMCLCVEMLMIAYAHKWAFPYEEFKGQAPALDGNSENNTMTRNLLSDNFALTDTVRDFNESKLLPNIVLPTGFVPGKGVEQAKKVPRVVSSKISKKKRTNSYGWRD